MKQIYAAESKVPISNSQAEIKKILTRYGATSFAFAEGAGNAMVMFELKNIRICFKLPLPQPLKNGATEASTRAYEQACRSRWRALVLSIKAKLECVNSEITTLENEFMAHIVLPTGQIFGEIAAPQIEQSYKTKEMPPLLGMR